MIQTAKKAGGGGPLHALPADLRKAVGASKAAKAAWDDITPLARNEWICWVTMAKQPQTRQKRVERTRDSLAKGQRRPCCWPGCPHRRPNAMKWFQPKPRDSTRRSSADD